MTQRIAGPVGSSGGLLNSNSEQSSDKAILTIPNLVTLARLALLPLALYFALSRHNFIVATALLVVIASSDFLDGYLARRLGQVSELGKIIDPSADRVVIVVILIVAIAHGWVPVLLGIVILAREVFISLVSAYLFRVRHYRMDVIWLGKAGTFLLLAALPAILLGQQTHPDLHFLHLVGLGLALGGTCLLYGAALHYTTRVLLPLMGKKGG